MTIDTIYDIGDAVQVVEGNYNGYKYKITAITMTLDSRNNKIPNIKYQGRITQFDIKEFEENQLTKCDENLDGYTWEVQEGDVILWDNQEWIVTCVRWGETHMGGNRGVVNIVIQKDGKEMTLYADDDVPFNVVGHKKKMVTFV
jgi:hypothetical protein